jgi:DNA-directed RNA polymerase subunit RPC12/RpoP
MNLQKYECTQCGSHDFQELSDNKIKCNYCSTVYRVIEPAESKPKVIIGKGANVVFGKSSNVTIKGGVEIKEGANVQFLGKLDILEIGDEEKIKNSEFYKLKNS